MGEYTSGPDFVESIRALDARIAALEAGPKGLWQLPVLEHGWTNFGGGYSPASYTIDDIGYVHLRGLVVAGEYEKSIFTLPVGARPASRELFADRDGASNGRIDVLANGEVFAFAYASPTKIATLAGILFLGER